MRVALFTPLMPVRTALADIIEGYLPYLALEFDLTIVTSGDYQPLSPLCTPGNTTYIRVINFQQFRQAAGRFDLVIYNLGDEPNIHGYMFDALEDYPGVVLLHDLVLHHAIFQRTWAQGKLDEYISELSYSYGQDIAERVVHQIRAGHFESVAVQYPLVERVLDTSLAVVGFNDYMVTKIRDLCPDLAVYSLRYPFYLPEGLTEKYDGHPMRRNLGSSDRTVIATFGLFNSQKRLELTLQAFQQLTKTQQVDFVLIGAALDKDLESRLNSLQLTEHVKTTGWLPPLAFVQYMFAVDIAVQLRYPHVGGTPYTPIRLLGLGVPTIISDIAPQADIPQSAVIRIVPDRGDEAMMVYTAMDYLLQHPLQRKEMGQAGRAYIQSHHDPAVLGPQFCSFLNTVHSQLPELTERRVNRKRGGRSIIHPSSNLTYLAGKALAEIGVNSTDTDMLRAVAGAILDLVRSESPSGG